MKTIQLLLPVLLVLGTTALTAQTPTVRVLFYTGSVSLNGAAKPTIGQQVRGHDAFTLGPGATLQLSVDGKVIKFAQAAKVLVADVIKRAGKGENAAVANTMRTLAAASSADKGQRTSQAGATRVEGGESEKAIRAREAAEAEARARADAAIRQRTGIENPIDLAGNLGTLGNRNERLVILEPRSTAVPPGPIRFRWLRAANASRYVISVKDHTGQEIYRTETEDTTAAWDGTSLAPEAIYEWTLTNARNEAMTGKTSFNRLPSADAAEVREGAEAIRKALGADNPALGLVLGAFYGEHGCGGTAARYYTEAALATPEHYREFMEHAVAIYREPIGLDDEELRAVFAGE